MARTPFVSYAQNGEDVVLQRLFAEQVSGFYIDIGGCHPVDDSVTAAFYARGWHGVNVEPDPALHALLAAERPRDVNICAAVTRSRGRVTFYATATRGHGTIDPERAAPREHLADGQLAPAHDPALAGQRVPALLLSDVVDCYGAEDGRIDFLKIDVEGAESEVIASGDWSRHRPRVVLVEAVDLEGVPNHAGWEPQLLASGYRFALFDGLNRFYVRDEDAVLLLGKLAAPANVFDDWKRVGEQRLALATERMSAELADAADRDRGAAATRAEQAAEILRQRAETDRLRHELQRLGAAIDAAQASSRALAEELASVRAEHLEVQETAVALSVEMGRVQAKAATALRREEAAETRMAELELRIAQTAVRDHKAAAEQAEERAAAERLAAALAALDARHAETEGWLNAVRGSSSWRMTRPLRVAGRLLRRKPLRGA